MNGGCFVCAALTDQRHQTRNGISLRPEKRLRLFDRLYEAVSRFADSLRFGRNRVAAIGQRPQEGKPGQNIYFWNSSTHCLVRVF